MKEDETTLKSITGLIVGIPIGILLGFYEVFIIQKLILWYTIPVSLSFLQLYGIDAIFGLMLFSVQKEKTKGGTWEAIGALFMKAIVFSFLMGILYIVHFILQ